MRLIVYIDDMLLLVETKAAASQQMLLLLDLLEALGFCVNYNKSVLEPAQEIEFLGFLVNSESMSIALPAQVTGIVKEVRAL